VIALLGGYGASVITALTAQNTVGVQGVFPVPATFIREQLDSVLSDIGADSVKTGMLAQAETIRLVSRGLGTYRLQKVVVDPVMVSQSGHSLMEPKADQSLIRELLPRAGLLTPNLLEASRLVGFPIRTIPKMREAAKRLKSLTRGAILIKGGHLKGPALDLFYDGASFREFSAPRVNSPHTHGTGCSYSTAIATFWAQGHPLLAAIEKGKQFIQRSILAGEPLGRGEGPTNPYAWIETELARYPVLMALNQGLERLKATRMGELIPEVQSNFGFALPFPRTVDEVAAFPGRICRFKDSIAALGSPEFGASRHVARIILTVVGHDPEYRAALNIRFSEEILKTIRQSGLRVGGFNRQKEPRELKRREGSSLSWGVGRVLEEKGFVPDFIYDRGDVGKEPMIRVLGKDPDEIADKTIFIKKRLAKNS
jgi:hydroxymethylpyrimidine kinase / phosphomethylpyrimidine kinase / thiamine-phosphate diphosphorylase